MQENSQERWKQIAGYENWFEVSTHGRVRSVDRIVKDSTGRKRFFAGIIRKLNIGKRGYFCVNLLKNGQEKRFYVHRLVAAAFIGPNGLQVNHKDRDKLNNHISNLEYVTQRENLNYSIKQNGLPTGVKKSGKKFIATIRKNRVSINLGTFDCPHMAHIAYLEAAGEEIKYASLGVYYA